MIYAIPIIFGVLFSYLPFAAMVVLSGLWGAGLVAGGVICIQGNGRVDDWWSLPIGLTLVIACGLLLVSMWIRCLFITVSIQ